MKELITKFKRLKMSVGGNREQMGYEDTFGMPKEEQAYITRPSKSNIRILSELEFALNLSGELNGKYNAEIERALDYLLSGVKENGVISNKDCDYAEELLAAMEKPAKDYKIILAGHAHIDMNWMWSYDETVAVTLATFRTILNIMDQYPDFCFSQSQAAVYKIVEEYDPVLMEKIKKRIAEGRWEVTATAWVETDKNLPSGEALLRHIQYTREYLSAVWGVSNFDVDFSPDTFGHNANVPEINEFGQVKYYYHCRGLEGENVLYRYRAASQKEILAYREPNWYNSAITPHMGAGLIKLSRRCAGLKTGLAVYGVGDHGGGPTRRDVERAMDMMTWKIYPTIKFGTIREFFLEAETVREKLPVIDHELNYFAPGCYTTQSRIKRGNKRLEMILGDAESIAVLADSLVKYPADRERFVHAWQDVLFNNFHDILTGSCVQSSREYAMGLYQKSKAAANTQLQNAMISIAEQIDTSSIPVDINAYDSQSEGAGVGYGVENFSGVPSTERGSGKTRIFHVFNSLPEARNEVEELTVWDWTGDLHNLYVKDYQGNAIEFQLLDQKLQNFWDHKYFRILVDVTVPGLGYTTIVISEKETDGYPVYFQTNERVSVFFNDYILKNEAVTAVLESATGRMKSLTCNESKREMISEGTAGLTYIQTEAATSSAWTIGRHLKHIPVDKCIKIEKTANGPLRQSIKATYEIENSTVDVIYSLDKHQKGVQIDIKADWKEIGGTTIPVLDYKVPVAYPVSEYMYDIPESVIRRKPLANDVPGLQYGMALGEGKEALILASDCKYGYRGIDNALALTLINSSTSPDPYPERGIHNIRLMVGICKTDANSAEKMANTFNHKLFYQPSNSHYGTLPMENSLCSVTSDHIIISAVTIAKDKAVIVRGYNTSGEKGKAGMEFKKKIVKAVKTDLFENESKEPVYFTDSFVSIEAEPYSIFEVKIVLT